MVSCCPHVHVGACGSQVGGDPAVTAHPPASSPMGTQGCLSTEQSLLDLEHQQGHKGAASGVRLRLCRSALLLFRVVAALPQGTAQLATFCSLSLDSSHVWEWGVLRTRVSWSLSDGFRFVRGRPQGAHTLKLLHHLAVLLKQSCWETPSGPGPKVEAS